MAKPKRVAHVICNGGTHAHKYPDFDPEITDCIVCATKYPEGNMECQSGCLGFGTCVVACKFDAIFINGNGVAEVDREKCTACGACIRKCPKNIIIEVPAYNTINMVCANMAKGPVARKQCDVSCIACGICEKSCPADAIHVIDMIAIIDDDKCIACGMCAVKCPRLSIADADRILAVIPGATGRGDQSA